MGVIPGAWIAVGESVDRAEILLGGKSASPSKGDSVMGLWQGRLSKRSVFRGLTICAVTGCAAWAGLPNQAHRYYVAPKGTVFPQYMGRTPAEGQALLPKAEELPLSHEAKANGANWVRQWADGTVYHQVRLINDDPPIYGRSIGAYYRCEVPGKGRRILIMRVNISGQPDKVFADRSKGSVRTGSSKREIKTAGAGPTRTMTAVFSSGRPAPGTPQGIAAQRGQVVTEVWMIQWARPDHPAGTDIVARCHELLMAKVEKSPMGEFTFDFPRAEVIPKLVPTEDAARGAFGGAEKVSARLSSTPPVLNAPDPTLIYMGCAAGGQYSARKGKKEASFSVDVVGVFDPFAAYERWLKKIPNRPIKGDWTGRIRWKGISGKASEGGGGLRCSRTLYHVDDKKKEKPLRTATLLVFQKGMFLVTIEGWAEVELGRSDAIAENLATQVLARMEKQCRPRHLAPRKKLPGGPTPPTGPEEKELTLRIEAGGFHARELNRSTKSDPSSFFAIGEIADGTLTPIAGATVSCPDLGITATTNARGIFILKASLDGKGDSWRLQETLKLKRVAGALTAKLTAKKGFFANGRIVDCSLEVLSDGRKLGNRRLYVVPEPDFLVGRDGKKSFCVVPGPGARSKFQGTIVLDALGATSFQLPMPVWRDKRVPVREQEVPLYFPVIGRIQIRDLVSDKVCYATYVIESPFPEVERFSMVATHAGDWQSGPASQLALSDADADVPLGDDPKYFVELKAYGELRLAGTGNTCKNRLANNFQGRLFHFNYRPPADWSEQIKNPPDLAKRLAKAALKQVVSVVVDKGVPGAGQKLASMANKGRSLYKLKKGADVYNTISTGINGWKAVEMSVNVADAIDPRLGDALLSRVAQRLRLPEMASPARWGQNGGGATGTGPPLGEPIRKGIDKLMNGEIGEKHDAQIQLIDQVYSVWDLSNNLAADLAGKTEKLFPKGMPKSLEALSKSGLPAEGLKMAYVLAKETYAVHRENWQIAMSYDKAISGRIEAWITDDDGHRIYVTRRPIVLAYRKGK
jgi:hypothetical protein